MSIANLSQYLIFIGIAGFLILAAFLIVDNLKVKEEQKRALGRVILPSFHAKFNIFAQRSYNLFLRIPILNRFVRYVRRRLEVFSTYDEYSLRREVMKILFTILSVVLFFILLLLFFRPSWLVIFWVFVGLLFLSGTVIDFFVYRVEAKLLKQLKDFNNRVRFYYQQTKMVDEAVYESIQYVGPEMKIHAEKIYDILTSIEPEKELAKYEEVAPTRFLKVIAGLSLLVKDQGDQISEKGSAYLRGLSAMNEELNHEILYRSNLEYRLRFLGTLCLIPIFLALPIKNWAISKFIIMQSFYDSRIGFLAEVSVYAIAIICYLTIRRMREVSPSIPGAKVKKIYWERWLFKKIPFVEWFAKALSPNPYTKRRFKLQFLLKDSNSQNTVEELTLQRIMLSLGIFLLLTIGIIYAHAREAHGVLNNVWNETFIAGKLSNDEYQTLTELTEFDKEVIARLQEKKQEPTPDKLRKMIAEEMDKDPNDLSVIAAYERISKKWEVVKNAYFKWYELLYIIGISYAVSYLPILNLRLKRFMRYREMEKEVHQILILISILREFEQMTVYTILNWMERFSIVFKEPIQICLQNYDSGPTEALDELNENVSFEAFQQIVERLKLAAVRISIKESFDDIDMERAFYLEQRKEAQTRSLENKSATGEILGFLPAFALILLFLVIPLIYIAMVETNEMMNYFK